MRLLIAKVLFTALVLCLGTGAVMAQAAADTPPAARPAVPRTIFRDSDGNLVTNNEFVDIRMANPSYPDRTIIKTLEDGTIEFRLQKIPQEGAEIPALDLRTLDGRRTSAAELRGKVLVINLWFIGCPPCMAEIPKLNDLAAKFDDSPDVRFVALTVDSEDKVKSFLRRERFDYEMVPAAQAEMSKFVFSGYPKNIVVGRDGKIVYWRSTIRAWDKFESVIRGEIAK